MIRLKDILKEGNSERDAAMVSGVADIVSKVKDKENRKDIANQMMNKFNLEDTLFAGALVQQLRTNVSNFCDAAIAAEDLYLKAKETGLREYLYKSSHNQRLKELNIEDDIQFCLKQNICNIIPIMKENKLIAQFMGAAPL